MSKVIMGNGNFYGCLIEARGVSAWWKETAKTSGFLFFSFLVAEPPCTSVKQNQTLTTHNANRRCRVRFYTFVGQPLLKQLYVAPLPPPTQIQIPLQWNPDITICQGN